jgi:hypothetical protein
VRWVFKAGDDASSAAFKAEDLKGKKMPVGGFHVTGYCPVCGHPTTSIFPLTGVTTTGRGNVLADGSPAATAGGGAASASFTYFAYSGRRILRPGAQKKLVYGSIHCNCAEFHESSGGKFGCGASWLLGTEIDLRAKSQTANPELHSVAEDDLGRYWPAAEAVAAAAPNALTTFQARAATWQSGVTGLATTAVLATLIADRAAIHGLETPFDFGVILLVIAAALASALNIAMALWANVGFPRVKQVADAETLADADLAPLTMAARASTWLRRATAAAVAAFLLGFAGLAMFLATPDQGAGDTKVTFTLYQTMTTTAPPLAPGSTATPNVTPGKVTQVTTTASPICAVIAGKQPTPPASPKGTPVIDVIEPSSSPTPSQATAIPVPSIARVSPGCP